MAEGRKIQCNEGCGEPFDLSSFSKIEIENGIEKTFFVCPHCKKEYVVTYTNEGIRRMQANQEADGKKMGLYSTTGNTDGIRRVQKRFDARAKKIYQRIEELKKQFN